MNNNKCPEFYDDYKNIKHVDLTLSPKPLPSMKSLQDSELEMFRFFEMTPDLVCIAGKDGYFRKFNQSVINKLEYTTEELMRKPIASFIHPEDREVTAKRRNELLKGKELINFQNRYLSKSGATVWLHWTSIYLPDKEVVFAIAKDVTDIKIAEKKIEEKYRKFKSLATHFKTSIEKDRKYLAVELHEELAQLAAVVKMDIEWIAQNFPDMNKIARGKTDHALMMSGLLIDSIRRISYSISPDMLDDMGLQETMKWLCQEFSILNGIPCHFECTADLSGLSQEIQLDFYRICQEALNNIMYHAEASSVHIRIGSEEESIYLVIADDGKGFDSMQAKPTSGLDHIRERVASIHGRLDIYSEPGQGTKITVSIPTQLTEMD